MKTLYVTDLDGTLMRDDKTISSESVAIFNRLIKKGICLTYATARSMSSASKITAKINFEIPVIIRNGTILADQRTKESLELASFGESDLKKIRDYLEGIAVPGFSTTYLEEKEYKLCPMGRMNEGFADYLNAHAKDPRIKMVDSEEEMFQGEVCYFTFIADKEELLPLYGRMKEESAFNCIFQQDKYRPEYWLEICPLRATKAKAIRRVQELCGCDRVVVFGDSLNDVSMFRTADEAYAVRNAMVELKEIATGIIDGNNEDGVARWLEKQSNLKCQNDVDRMNEE